MKARGLSIVLVAILVRTSVLDAAADNAATFYQQAIAALPTEPKEVQAFHNWTSVPLDASTFGIVQRCQQSRLLLHRGAQAVNCDWGWDYKKGPALQIPELSRLRYVGQAAALWIRASFEQRHEAEALQSIEDLLILGRRIDAVPLVVTGLLGRALQAEGMYVGAAYLQTLTPASLQQLQSFLEALPQDYLLSESLQKERSVTIDLLFQAIAKGGNDPLLAALPKQSGEASKAVACQDLFAEAARIASLPPDQATQAMEAFKARLATAPAIYQKVQVVADPSRLAMADARHREEVALFKAAITVIQKSPAGVSSTADPMGGGPFSYRQIPNGFELVSKLIDRGEAVTVQVGPEALAAESAHAKKPVGKEALAAEPAQAKKPIPSNWVKVTNRAHHFEYFVPPTWTHTPDSDVEIQFQIPINPKKNDFGFGMFVVAARPTQSVTLEDDAAEERKNLSTDSPRHKDKVTKEEKVDFNGRPAWRFEHTDVYDAPVNGGSAGSIKETTRRLEMLVHDGQTHFLILYQISATHPDNIYKQFLPQAQQVFDSFKWNDSTDK